MNFKRLGVTSWRPSHLGTQLLLLCWLRHFYLLKKWHFLSVVVFCLVLFVIVSLAFMFTCFHILAMPCRIFYILNNTYRMLYFKFMWYGGEHLPRNHPFYSKRTWGYHENTSWRNWPLAKSQQMKRHLLGRWETETYTMHTVDQEESPGHTMA